MRPALRRPGSTVPAPGKLVIARMANGREPFGVGLVIEPLPHEDDVRLDQLQAFRAQRAAEAQMVRAPTSKTGSKTVRVHWYDLESGWVERLRLLDDAHWASQFAAHAQSDALTVALLGHAPPSFEWIVEQYKGALFLPKSRETPADVAGAVGNLTVDSLIVAAAPRELLDQHGAMHPHVFDWVMQDLVEPPQLQLSSQPAAAGGAPGSARSPASPHTASRRPPAASRSAPTKRRLSSPGMRTRLFGRYRRRTEHAPGTLWQDDAAAADAAAAPILSAASAPAAGAAAAPILSAASLPQDVQMLVTAASAMTDAGQMMTRLAEAFSANPHAMRAYVHVDGTQPHCAHCDSLHAARVSDLDTIYELVSTIRSAVRPRLLPPQHQQVLENWR